MPTRRSVTRVAAALALVMSAVVQAQPRVQPDRHGPDRREREHERERYQTPHWVFDGRFHHNHYYPAIGYSIGALPFGFVTLAHRGVPYYFQGGVWYQRNGPGFIVVRPPVGLAVPALPPAYATIWAGNVPYYYANDVYYVQTPGGYAVVPPPMQELQAQPVQPVPPPVVAAPAPAPSAPQPMWYFCDAANAYYPYVKECPGPWRPVPATPPR